MGGVEKCGGGIAQRTQKIGYPLLRGRQTDEQTALPAARHRRGAAHPVSACASWEQISALLFRLLRPVHATIAGRGKACESSKILIGSR